MHNVQYPQADLVSAVELCYMRGEQCLNLRFAIACFCNVAERSLEVMSIQQTQQLYDTLENYFTLSEETFGHDDKIVDKDIQYVSVLRGDIAKYVYYLTKTDGELDVREANYINELTGYKLSQVDVIFLAQNSGKRDRSEYLTSAPKSLILALWSDEKFRQKGEKKNGYELILEMLKFIAIDLVNTVGRIALEEQQTMASVYQQLDRIAHEEYEKLSIAAPVLAQGDIMRKTDGGDSRHEKLSNAAPVPASESVYKEQNAEIEAAPKEVILTTETEKGVTVAKEEAVTQVTGKKEHISATEKEAITLATGTDAVTATVGTKEVVSAVGNVSKKTGTAKIVPDQDKDQKIVNISNSIRVEKEEKMEQNEDKTRPGRKRSYSDHNMIKLVYRYNKN